LHATVGACATALLPAVIGCGRESASDTIPPVPPATVKATTASRPVADPKEGPMALFERCCASCHGPHGSLYGDKLTRAKDGSLSGVILNMMETQARLDPTAAMVDAMTAYHRAIRDRFLFLWVANSADARPGESRVLRGEAAPNARVELLKGDVLLRAERTGTIWIITNPPEPPFRLVARTDSDQVGLDYPHQTFSTGSR